MASFERDDRRNSSPSDPLAGSLPQLAPARPDIPPTPYAIVTSLLPARERRPLQKLELPERKAAFLNGLSSQNEEEFRFALGSLKDWMPKPAQKVFWPIVLEVLSSPEDRKTFSASIAARSSVEAGFADIALASLLDTVNSSSDLGHRQLRCQARILAAMVWWAPETLGVRVADALDTNQRLLRPFAVALAFTGCARTALGFAPSLELCRYLDDGITQAAAQVASHRELLFSSGALQLASSFSTSLPYISAALTGHIREGIFGTRPPLSSMRLFLNSMYDRTESNRPDDTDYDRVGRFVNAFLVTEEVAKLFPRTLIKDSPETRDLFHRMLHFSFACSTEDGFRTASWLVRQGDTKQLSAEQRAALEFVGNEFTTAPEGELSKHLASPATLEAFMEAPATMALLAQRAKEALDEEARKTSPEVDGSLSRLRLELLHHAQKDPPTMCWWKALALIATEEVASQVLAVYEKTRIGLPEFLDITTSIIPYVKGPQDLRDSLELWLAPSTQTGLFFALPDSLKDGESESVEGGLLAYFLSRDLRDQPAVEKIRELVPLLTDTGREKLSAYMGTASESSMRGPWQGAGAELETYNSFVETFGSACRPKLYDAYRTLSGGTSWGRFSSRDDLLAYRMELLGKLCRDELRTECTDPLELELLDHICHLSTNTFGDKETALASIRHWWLLSHVRQRAHSAALSPSPGPGQSRKSWGEQHAAATRAERAWEAFTAVGPATIQIARRESQETFSVPKDDFARFYYSALSDFGRCITGEVQTLGSFLSKQRLFQDILSEHPIPSNSAEEDVCAWQRVVLRTAVERSVSGSLPNDQLDNFRLGVSFLTLRLLGSPSGPGQKRYLRYNEAVYRHNGAADKKGHALLWLDIAAGLFEGALADEYLLKDADWNAERRQAFLAGLRAALPCDSMAAALERQSAAARSHPLESERPERSSLTMIPTRGLARELSGHLFDVCWAENESVFDADTGIKDGRQNIISLTFVRDYNTPKATIVGGSLIVVGYNNEAREQPVLIIRGCNPRSSFLNEVYVGDFFDQWVAYISKVAKSSGMLVAIPADPVPFLALTNQPDLYYYARRRYFGGKKLNVGSVALTEFNGIRVGDRLRSIGDPL